jgi:hypothetical protein
MFMEKVLQQTFVTGVPRTLPSVAPDKSSLHGI